MITPFVKPPAVIPLKKKIAENQANRGRKVA
nr:MAG TPA: hypothetical protein [Caudoviricetes sp.]